MYSQRTLVQGSWDLWHQKVKIDKPTMPNFIRNLQNIVTSKQIIKKEMMEPNILKLSQRLLNQRTLNVDVHNNSPIHIPIHLKPFGYKNGHYYPNILKFHYMKSPIFGVFLDANGQCQVVYLLRKSHKNFL